MVHGVPVHRPARPNPEFERNSKTRIIRSWSPGSCNPKMSILFFWLERGGRWGSSPSTSPADHQKLNVIQNEHFIFLAGEGWRMRFYPSTSPAVHQKFNVIQKWAFYFERGGGWGSSPSTSHADHQKLNVIQKWAFYFVGWRGVANGVRVHRPAQEVESHPKMSILFFWLERGGRWGSSPSISPADHQKLNIIQKWAFHFFGWRGVVNGVWVHRPAWQITRNWT